MRCVRVVHLSDTFGCSQSYLESKVQPEASAFEFTPYGKYPARRATNDLLRMGVFYRMSIFSSSVEVEALSCITIPKIRTCCRSTHASYEYAGLAPGS